MQQFLDPSKALQSDIDFTFTLSSITRGTNVDMTKAMLS